MQQICGNRNHTFLLRISNWVDKPVFSYRFLIPFRHGSWEDDSGSFIVGSTCLNAFSNLLWNLFSWIFSYAKYKKPGRWDTPRRVIVKLIWFDNQLNFSVAPWDENTIKRLLEMYYIILAVKALLLSEYWIRHYVYFCQSLCFYLLVDLREVI